MKTTRAIAALLIATTALAGAPAFAQTGANEADTERDGDIIVTANKRQERIQDVALSITAINGEELNDRRLIDIQDLSTRVPGFSFSRGNSQGPGQRIIIRGLNTGGVNGTVASSLDDVPLSASAATSAGGEFAADFDPYDLQRVEVLKGPQGTLYGANSLGGLVKYVTNAPDTKNFTGGFDFGASNLLHGSTGAFVKGFVNVPIVQEVAALRVSGFYDYQPGWIRNALGNNPRTNTLRRYGGRASLIVKPTSDLTIRATAMLQNYVGNGYDNVEVNGYTSASNPFGLLNGYNRNTYLDEPNTRHSEIYALNLDYNLGSVRLQSITSYGNLASTYRFDSPFYAPLSGLFFGRPNTTLASDSVNSIRKFNQEFRLASTNNAASEGHGLEWQVGTFYTRETSESTNNYLTVDATTRQTVITPASVAATPPGTPQVFLATFRTKYREYAGYVDLTYHFTPMFDIEAGGRLFRNEQSYTLRTGGALFSPAAFTTNGPYASSQTKATFAVAPRLHFGRNLTVYGRVSSGYRPGGPNPALPPADTSVGSLDTPGSPPASYGADTTINYEIGTKGSVFGNVLFFDLSAFYINWSNIQVIATYRRALTGYMVTINGGDATSKGIEWNVNVRPTHGLSLGILGSYNEAKLKGGIPQIGGSAGTQLPFVPKWTTTITADYEFPIGNDLTATFGGAYSHIGSRFSNYGFNPARSYINLPAYDQWSAQAGVRFGKYAFQVYGKNLTDSRGITNYDPGASIFGVPFAGVAGIIRPREIGLRLSGSF